MRCLSVIALLALAGGAASAAQIAPPVIQWQRSDRSAGFLTELGSTGDSPVPPGHWPGGTGRGIPREPVFECNAGVLPVPLGESPSICLAVGRASSRAERRACSDDSAREDARPTGF